MSGINLRRYIEKELRIRDKDAKVVPLLLNGPQKKLYDALAAQNRAGKPMRAIVLKARQMGFSTLAEAMIFKRTATRKNVRSGIVAHKEESAANLFRMSKLFYEELPDLLKPQLKTSNARELVFDGIKGEGLKSTIRVMTAGGQGIGRSDTFQNLHLSEFAFWPGDKKMTLAGLLQAVPDRRDTMVIIESTANGFDEFKVMWDRAVANESEFVPVFCAWWEQPEYRRSCPAEFEVTEKEARIAETFDLDHEQLCWRRWCIENNCGGDEKLFEQEYPASPEEAFIATGNCVFDKEALVRRLTGLPRPLRTGEFTFCGDGDSFRMTGFVQSESGGTHIYEEPRPGVPYVIGADTAGEGSDWFVAQVLDNTTGRQVAVLRRQFGEDEFARQAVCLGYYYNTALLGIEANFSTYPIREVERLRYPHQYMRETEDSYTHRLQRRYGFKTTATTRPVAIAGLIQAVRENVDLLCDAVTLREMLVFVRDERGRPQAMEREHDDCVMALAIAQYIRPQQSFLVVKAPKEAQREKAEYESQLERFLSF